MLMPNAVGAHPVRADARRARRIRCERFLPNRCVDAGAGRKALRPFRIAPQRTHRARPVAWIIGASSQAVAGAVNSANSVTLANGDAAVDNAVASPATPLATPRHPGRSEDAAWAEKCGGKIGPGVATRWDLTITRPVPTDTSSSISLMERRSHPRQLAFFGSIA